MRAHPGTGRREAGAAAVEFALVAALLILLLLAIFNFGLAYFRYQGAQAAAREGARVGALVTTTEAQVVARVNAAMDGVVGGDATYDILVNGGSVPLDSGSEARPCAGAAEQISVRVAVSMPLVFPLWDGPGSLSFAGTGDFRCEK